MSLQNTIDSILTRNIITVKGATFSISDPNGKITAQSKSPFDYTVGAKLNFSLKEGAGVEYVVTSSRPLTAMEKDAIKSLSIGMIDRDVKKAVEDHNKKHGTKVKVKKEVKFKVGNVQAVNAKDANNTIASAPANALASNKVAQAAIKPKIGVRM
jgi:hypothetical protein